MTAPGGLGTPVDLVNATVTAAPVVPCRSALPGVDLVCRDVTARLDSGPEKGESTTLDITESPDQPTLREGDRVVLGRAADPGSRWPTSSPTSSAGPRCWPSGCCSPWPWSAWPGGGGWPPCSAWG